MSDEEHVAQNNNRKRPKITFPLQLGLFYE
jgi:hypothetical protein